VSGGRPRFTAQPIMRTAGKITICGTSTVVSEFRVPQIVIFGDSAAGVATLQALAAQTWC
jgi:hypothetical protein